MVADGHAGGEIQLLEFGAELAEADAGAVRDLGAAVQVQHLDVPAVLGKGPEQEEEEEGKFYWRLTGSGSGTNKQNHLHVSSCCFYAMKSNFHFVRALLQDLNIHLKYMHLCE